MKPNSPHIGHEIERCLHNQGRTVAWLAKQMNLSRPNVYRIFQRPTIDTGMLQQISYILHFNFFDLYTNQHLLEEPSDEL
ncbi:MAG: hypothetical protein IJ680_01985 [Paludibacteraceae bacterium]|nr:hypothetical protein [Paludibacteraceae bacterium]